MKRCSAPDLANCAPLRASATSTGQLPRRPKPTLTTRRNPALRRPHRHRLPPHHRRHHPPWPCPRRRRRRKLSWSPEAAFRAWWPHRAIGREHHQRADAAASTKAASSSDRPLSDRAAGWAAVHRRTRARRRSGLAFAIAPTSIAAPNGRHLVRRAADERKPHPGRRLFVSRQASEITVLTINDARQLTRESDVLHFVERLLRHRELRDASGERQSRDLHAARHLQRRSAALDCVGRCAPLAARRRPSRRDHRKARACSMATTSIARASTLSPTCIRFLCVRWAIEPRATNSTAADGVRWPAAARVLRFDSESISG